MAIFLTASLARRKGVEMLGPDMMRGCSGGYDLLGVIFWIVVLVDLILLGFYLWGRVRR